MIRPPSCGRGVATAAAMLIALLSLVSGLLCGCGGRSDSGPLTMIVMDPLARELACPCVGGYAQRDYHALGEFLADRLGCRVMVAFADSLPKGLRQAGARSAWLVVGKESLVQADAAQGGLSLRPLARLTDPAGRTTLTGLFLVRADDPARAIADLDGRRILFGPPDSLEKHGAALAALVEHGVSLPAQLETRGSCSGAAGDVQDSDERPAPVAVISSYAFVLLEGCGNVERGALRVLGQTRPVPFITAFAGPRISPATAVCLREAFLAVRTNADLLKLMESRDGFVPWTGADWPDWRGANRDGLTAALPTALPRPPRVIWRKPTASQSLAGLAATGDVVLVAERDSLDEHDVFHCLRAADGATLWRLEYPATGRIDYGNSPRATPVVRGDRAYLLGAFGDLHCVTLARGEVVWKRQLVEELGGKRPAWGYCSTPLIVDDLLIVNPGGKAASLVALNRHTGQVVWQTPGGEAAYGSFILGEFGGRRQIVGYDAASLGGWDVRTGRRLWTLVPPNRGDFNVPTPVAVGDKLLVVTENNGARLYRFCADGRIDPQPVAATEALSPDTTTPVAANGRVFGLGSGLVCLDLQAGLRPVWTFEDNALATHASLFAAGDRLLALTYHGELLLLDATAPSCDILARFRLAPEDAELYAHPALVGGRLYVRDISQVVCYALD